MARREIRDKAYVSPGYRSICIYMCPIEDLRSGLASRKIDETLGKGSGRRESLVARGDSSGGEQAVRSEMLSGVVGESFCGSCRYKSCGC